MITRTCKKCGFQSTSLSVFMSHIRREHPWNSSKPKKAKRVKKLKAKHTRELTVHQVLNGAATFAKPQLSALDLLDKLKEQRDLMITVCNMIEGVINQ